jgi:hypothetical protein
LSHLITQLLSNLFTVFAVANRGHEGLISTGVEMSLWFFCLLRPNKEGCVFIPCVGKQMRCCFTIFCTVVPALLFLSSAFASRPLTTDDAYTVEEGTFQVETGLNFLPSDNHDKEFAPTVTLSYGVFERMDMGVGSAYLFVHPDEGKKENGFGDTALKIKYRLVDQKDWIPSFAVSGTLILPTASESKGLGSGKTDFTLNTIFTWNLSKKLQLHANLGYTFTGEHAVNNELNYSGAVQFFLSDKWALVGEIVGVNNFNGRKGDDPFSGLLGTQYFITDRFVWDTGVEIGMSKAAPDFRFTTGLTLLFKP